MPSTEQDKAAPQAGHTANWQDRLALIDRSVDWQAFDKYLRWIKPDSQNTGDHSPLVLFKAMLLQHWHGLIAADFDYLVSDSMAFRKFIGVPAGTAAPDHLAIATFRRLLIERDIATDVFGELRRQFEASALLNEPTSQSDASSRSGQPSPYVLASDVEMFEPPAWAALEQSYLRFWSDQPALFGEKGFASAALADIPDSVRTHCVVFRALNVRKAASTGQRDAATDGHRITADDFVLEWAGDSIADGEHVAPVKTTLREKADANLETYGHAGIHSNLLKACHLALSERRAIRTSGYILDDAGKYCQFWSVFAPANTVDSPVQLLTGVVLFMPMSEPLLAGARTPYTFDKVRQTPKRIFGSDVSHRALGPSDWVKIEQGFLDYWNGLRGERQSPQLSDIKLTSLFELGPYLTVTRVLPDNQFRYEYIGQHIKTANEGDATGAVVSAKAKHNTIKYGHPGLQHDLLAVFSRAANRVGPAGTSTYYINSGGRRCQMWTVHAPVADDQGRIAMLLGVTLIKPLAVN